MRSLRKMKNFRHCLIVFLAILFFIGPDNLHWAMNSAVAQPINPPRTAPKLHELVQALKQATSTNADDTDSDGLPDSVEFVIGTDPNSYDTDLDRLGDSLEVENDLDPLDPDSNHDGLPDYYEVNDVPSLDVDGDGFENAWDFDNDGDGVNDNVDFSPFSKSATKDNFHFDISTSGHTLYMSFQLRPKNPEHLKLFDQSWDWPDGDTEGAMQDRDGSKEDVTVLPTLALTVDSPPDQNDVVQYGITVDANNVSVPLLPVFEHGTIVAFTGRMVYPNSAPNDLDMDVKLVWKVIGRNDPNESLFGQDTLLATYDEDFTLIGMSFDENYGSDAGLFYSNDVNQIVAANLLLAYEFLRNSDNHVPDMPGVLDSNDVNVAYQLDSFAHRDEAFASMMDDMIPEALDWLPEDQNLPIVAILENTSASLDMSEFGSVSVNSFDVDLASAPVMVSKTLKTTWYNTSNREALLTKDVMARIHEMDLEETASYTLMTLMLYWETGEQEFYNINDPPTGRPDDFGLILSAVKETLALSLNAFGALYRTSLGLAGLVSYPSVKPLQMKGWNPSIAGKPQDLAKMGNFDKVKGWVKECGKIKNTVSEFKSMSKLLKGMEIVGIAVDIGFSIYSIIAICESDAGGFAKSSALAKVGLEIGYAIVMFGIAYIPYVGWAIALGIALSDVFGGWTDVVFDWLAGLIVKVSYTVKSEIIFLEGPTIDINDKDDNGLDVGDRITFSTRLQGKIQGNKAHWGLVEKSSIVPYHLIYAPRGSSSQTDALYWLVIWEIKLLPIGPPYTTYDKNEGWKAVEYDAGGWVEPGTAMVNFPVTIKTEALYEIWYEYKYIGIFPENDYESGKTDPNSTRLYFDVLPGSIEDFARWRGITPLDHDGDGLRDVNEVQSNPWIYDTDGDGLNDKYELDNLTDPKKYDTDGDGLIDWFEIQIGTDPLNPDTDGDGLLDYLEIAGWLIQFEYAGQTFTTRVYSDPAIPDSDSDGVEDYMEYRSVLNPRSADTNGDGANDIANPKDEYTVLELETYTEIDNDIIDIAVDGNGDVYVLCEWPSEMLRKYDSDMNFITEWDLTETDAKSMAIDDKNEIVYFVCVWDDDSVGSGGLIRYDMNTGEPLDAEPWGVAQLGQWWSSRMELDVDEDGTIYVLRFGDKKEWFDNPAHPDYPTYYGKEEYTGHVYVDVYDPNQTLLDTWGQYGTLLNETYIEGSEEIWRFYYPAEPDKLHNVQDIALSDDGSVYIPEHAAQDNYYRWKYMGWDGWKWIDCWDCSRQPQSMKNRISKFNTAGGWSTEINSFTDPKSGQMIELRPVSAEVDTDGSLYIVNGNDDSIYKFDRNLVPTASWKIASWTQQMEDDSWPVYRNLAVDDEGNIYTYFYVKSYVNDLPVYRGVVEKYSQKAGVVPPVEDPNPDSDQDGLLNEDEVAGWDITFTDPNGTYTVHVTSDPLLMDTDLDGLPDPNEYEIRSNPRNPDTDSDGLSDFDDVSPMHFDADADGLNDGTEMAYGSDPNAADTDQDGLTDSEECELESDPNNADTDRDGVDDAQEKALDADLLSPDSDGDFMFDGAEVDSGTQVNNSDSDNDGLSDGIEGIHNTDPLNEDTDSDGISDGDEVELALDPLSEDTDNDGVPDGTEIEQGTSPWNRDSDHDGVPDGQDNPNNLAPDVNNAHASKAYLWPPNNEFVEITIEGVTDPDNDPVQIGITGVTSDEPSTTSRGDKKAPDALTAGSSRLLLRAERSGSGNGRVYEISFVAGDNKGGYTQGKVQVKVPHSNGKKDRICIDDGQKYNVLQ